MPRRVVHRTLDGKRIGLAGELDLSRPYTSVARYFHNGRLHEFSSGEIDSARAWAEDIGVDRFTEEFALQGGRLRIGRTVTHDARAGLTEQVLAAVWEGRRHAVFTHLYHARPADAVALFSGLALAEDTDGVAMRPRGRTALAEPAELVKEVPGLGLLEITGLTRQTARRLPPWPGARLRSGELFQDTIEEQGVYFLLATAAALVTVLPDEREVAKVPGRLAGLTVEVIG